MHAGALTCHEESESTAFVCNPVLLLLLRQRLQRTTGDYGDVCSFLSKASRMDLFEPCYSHASGGSGSLVSLQFGLKLPILFVVLLSLLPSQPNNTPKAQRDGHLVSAAYTHTHTRRNKAVLNKST